MKRISRRAIICLLLIACGYHCGAQQQRLVSKTPVTDPSSARAALFSLPEDDTAYYFRADLPGDNFLVIRFGKLSYWQSDNLADIIATAKRAWQQTRDSFTGIATSRRIAAHIPPSSSPVILSIHEWGNDERMMVMSGANVQPVRIAVDTITILKTLRASGNDTADKRQIHYTFLLKDLSGIEMLADNTALVEKISRTFDSVVAAKKMLWKTHADAYYQRLAIDYDVHTGAERPGKIIADNRSGLTHVAAYIYANGGISFIAGQIAVAGNANLAYQWTNKTERRTYFVAASYSVLNFTQIQNSALTIKNLGFVNLEFGRIRHAFENTFPDFITSFGLGYRVYQADATPYDFRARLFLNYSVSKAVTLTPETYYIPKEQGLNARSFFGLTVGIRIL